MTRQEQLAIANEVLPILFAFNTNGQAKADYELRQKVKELYSSITGVYMVDVSCNSCLIHYLNMILSWKERVDKEIAAEQANQPEPVQEEQPQPEQEPEQEPEAKEEPKKKGKKKNN